MTTKIQAECAFVMLVSRVSTEIVIFMLAASVVFRFMLKVSKTGLNLSRKSIESPKTPTTALKRQNISKFKSKVQETPTINPENSHKINQSFFSVDTAPIWKQPFHYLPKVPFYMYTDKRLNWLANCKLNPRNLVEKHKTFKHGDDVWFLEQAENHPWRVTNPEHAKIFIVPTIMSYVMRYQHCTSSVEALPSEPVEAVPVSALHPGHADWVKRWGVMQTAVSIGLRNSSWFKKNEGRDHIIVSSDFHMRYPNVLGNRMQSVMKNMIYGYFEDLPNIDYDHSPDVYEFSRVESPNFWGCTVVVPYVDQTFSHDPEKYDFDSWKTREIDFIFLGQYDSRDGYQLRRHLSMRFKMDMVNRSLIYARTHDNPDKNAKHGPKVLRFNYPMEKCDLDTCLGSRLGGKNNLTRCIDCYFDKTDRTRYLELMTKSKFALILSGDTASSSRIYDAISSGMIPVILGNSVFEIGLPFHSIVPWRDLCIFIDTKNLMTIIPQIELIFKKPEEKLKHKYLSISRYKDDVSWSSPTSRVVDNVLTESLRKCF